MVRCVLILLKVIQLVFCVVIVVACFLPCEIKKKNDDKTYLSRYRQYNLNQPDLLFDQSDDEFESRADGPSFSIIYTLITFACCSMAIIFATLVCKCCKKLKSATAEATIQILALAVWVPLTFCFIWTLVVTWSDNAVLSNYSRPSSWILAAGGAFCLTLFLLVDLFFLVLFNIHQVLSVMQPKISKSQEAFFGRSHRSPRLAVSLNSVDMDPDCENIKVL